MKLLLHPLYKNLLLLAVVLGPIVWLVLTEDGQRRSDLAVLALLGEPELNLAIEHLHGNLTQRDLEGLFPHLELACADRPTPFGTRLCTVAVGAFNQVPAHAFTVYLEGERLRAAKVNYRRRYHAFLQRQIDQRLGAGDGRDEAGKGAVSWQVEDGLLLMPAARPQGDGDAALMWLSSAALQRRARSGT